MSTARSEFHRRVEPARALAGDAELIARACQAMAVRFGQGGKLVVFGSGAAATDAEHIAVEFVHPVIVGKRALPALSLAGDAATLTGLASRRGMEGVFAHQVAHWAVAPDIALGVSPDGACASVAGGLEAAHDLGCLTIALVGGDGGRIGGAPYVDHALGARSSDPCIVKEIHVTTYHILWELVHVFLEQGATPDPCAEEVCITCSDQATPLRVVELLPGGLARVEGASGTEEVSVALVDARVGATVLVHAGEAIAVVGDGT